MDKIFVGKESLGTIRMTSRTLAVLSYAKTRRGTEHDDIPIEVQNCWEIRAKSS